MFGADDLLEDDSRQALERALGTWCRTGSPFALLLIDLDGFADVSARFGANVGDLLLYEITSRIRGMLGNDDRVARSGPSEFAVLAAGVRRIEDAEQLATRLIERLQSPTTVNGTLFRLSASIGITLSPRKSGEWRLLLQDADAAVHDARTLGRGRVSIVP